MFDQIAARQARDLVKSRFSAEQPRVPAARARRAAAGPSASLRSASARLLRALADRVEPAREPRRTPRSA